MLRSTFGAFTTAQLALRASQRALDLTGHNIANINTQGYTRQNLDLVSLHMGGSDRYASSNDVKAGHGVLISGVSQIRDPFLDKRFRTEIANVGEQDQKSTILSDLEDIFDEVAKKGLESQLTDLSSKLQSLSSQVGNKEFDSMVKSSAEVLTKLFNQYAKQVESVRTEYEENITNAEIPDLNNIIKNIQNLNKTIKNCQVSGDPALELLDQRNQLIDELASYVPIEVKYKPVKISSDDTIEELNINLVGSDGTKYSIINDDKAGSFSVAKNTDGKMVLGLTTSDGNAVASPPGSLGINSLVSAGSLKASLEMLNGEGEFDTTTVNAPRGIGYYEKSLNSLANMFATQLNEANNLTPGSHDLDLFQARDNSGVITAKNISIAKGWANNEYGITATKTDDPVDGNPVDPGTGEAAKPGQNENVIHMINLLSQKLEYKNNAGTVVFKGSFQECFSNTSTVLGLDIKSTNALLKNYVSVATDINNSRDSISGVSLDEEGINILKYQKSLTAASRLMTALDEALDTIINKMGIVGR